MYVLDTAFEYRNYIIINAYYDGINTLLYLLSNTIPIITYYLYTESIEGV